MRNAAQTIEARVIDTTTPFGMDPIGTVRPLTDFRDGDKFLKPYLHVKQDLLMHGLFQQTFINGPLREAAENLGYDPDEGVMIVAPFAEGDDEDHYVGEAWIVFDNANGNRSDDDGVLSADNLHITRVS